MELFFLGPQGVDMAVELAVATDTRLRLARLKRRVVIRTRDHEMRSPPLKSVPFFRTSFLATLSLALLLAGCGREVAIRSEPSPSPKVPSDWQTITYEPLGFSLRFPPGWGPRSDGEMVSVAEGCHQSIPTLNSEGEPDNSYECQLEPQQARKGPPDPGFYLGIRVEHLVRGETMESFLQRDEQKGREVGAASFAGRRWTTIDLLDPDCCPPTKDYGHCLGPDGEPSQCMTREYLSDHGGQLIFSLTLWSQSPAEFAQFEGLAEQAVHSVEFQGS